MAQGRSTKTISTIKWIRTSKLLTKKSLVSSCHTCRGGIRAQTLTPYPYTLIPEP